MMPASARRAETAASSQPAGNQPTRCRPAGAGRVAITVDLFDRRTRTRVARRSFEASVPAADANSAAAAQAMSQAVARVFDDLLPWLETELRRAARAPD